MISFTVLQEILGLNRVELFHAREEIMALLNGIFEPALFLHTKVHRSGEMSLLLSKKRHD